MALFIKKAYEELKDRGRGGSASLLMAAKPKPKPHFYIQLVYKVALSFKLLFNFEKKSKKSHFYFNQLFSVDATIFSKKYICKEKVKKHQKNCSEMFFFTFSYCHELPKRPKQKNLCSKM